MSSRASPPPRRVEAGLLVIAGLCVVGAYSLASFGLHGDGLPPRLVVLVVVVLVVAGVAHVATRILTPLASPVMLPIVLLLNGLGWVMISRLDTGLDTSLATDQAIWTLVGVAVYIATLALLKRSADLERYRFILLSLGVVLLFLPLLPRIGQNINGARLWIKLGPITFQPVELGKLALVIFFASYFAEKRELLSRSTARFGRLMVPDPRPFGPILLAWGFAMVAMTAERNVGFALLVFVVFMVMLWVAAGRPLYVVIGAILFVAGAYGSAHLFSQVHERIVVWLNPWNTATTTGYQLIQAEYALGSGGVTGTGLGLGHPYLVPVSWSDFIFTSFGEELGLLGTTILIAAFVALVGAGLRAALRARNDFAKLAAAGLTAVLGFQSLFIMAGNVRLLPLTGVTLPWVAYGGSSLVANYVLLAILIRISDEGEHPILLRPA